MMKKIISRITASAMVIVMAVSSVGSRVLASSSASKTRYISEVTVSYAGTYEEAKKELEGNGYKIASDINVNDTLNAPVYMGYKETTDKKDAITDLAVMNMSGNFSFTDYENLMKSQRSAVENQMGKILLSIKAFREKYKSGSTLAAKVYDYLNYIYDEVSGKKMGDYLLKCDIDPEDHEELTDVFMKGNSYLVNGIFQALALCADPSDTTLFTRLQDVTYDDLEERYLALYKSSINKALAAMDVDYGNDAREILSVWDGFYEKMMLIQESGINEETGTYKVEEGEGIFENSEQILEESMEAADVSVEEQEYIEDTNEFFESSTTLQEVESTAVYDKLLNTEYGDGTLLDFFLRPSEEVELEELYPLCEALTKAQKAVVSTTGLEQIFSSAMTTSDEENQADYSYMDQMLAGMESISIYDGIDLDIYEKGVALTSEATRHQDSSPSSWTEIFSNPFETEYKSHHWGNYICMIVIPSILLPTILWTSTKVVEAVVVNQAEEATKKMVGKGVEYIFNDPKLKPASFSIKFKNLFAELFFDSTPTLKKVANMLAILTYVVLVVAIVLDIYLLVKNITSTQKGIEYDVIPHHMMHAVSNKRGTNYTMYKKATAVDGSTAADLNGYKGKNGWLVLYYTKDEMAGEPLTKDIQIKTGTSNMPVSYSSVHLFGNENAVNLTSEDYTGVEDKVGGTYMYVKHSDQALAGSTFAGGFGMESIYGILAGLACGILAGVAYNKGKGRKKQEVGLS